jgi:GGDEF domain-containing protein
MALRMVAPWIAHGLPWVVVAEADEASGWLDAGAWAVLQPGLPDGVPERTAEALFEKVLGARQANPLTGLPGNRSIGAALAALLGGSGGSAAYVDIEDFKPFNDYYGFARGDAVIRLLGGLLRAGLPGCFVGHVGGDDFVCAGDGEVLERGLADCREAFRSRVVAFYNERDRPRGGIETLDRNGRYRFFPFLDITTVMVDPRCASSVEELAGMAGLEKKRRKGDLLPQPVRDCAGGLEVLLREGRYGERDAKAVIEAAGIAGDRRMTALLTSLLEGGSGSGIRKSAALSLGFLQGPDTFRLLSCAAGDPSPHVRTRAVEALALSGDERAAGIVEAACRDSSTWVRRAALRALGAVGSAGSLELLLSRASHASEGRDAREERRAALEGIALRPCPEAAGPLGELLGVRGYEPRDALWAALAASGEEGALLVREHAASESEAAAALPRVNPASLSPRTLGLLEDAAVGLLETPSAPAALRFLAGVPAPGGRRLHRALERMAARSEGGEFGLVLTVMEKRRLPPGADFLSELSARIERRPHAFRQEDVTAVLRMSADGTRPGSLLPFLRSRSRETAVAASRAVLQILAGDLARS